MDTILKTIENKIYPYARDFISVLLPQGLHISFYTPGTKEIITKYNENVVYKNKICKITLSKMEMVRYL